MPGESASSPPPRVSVALCTFNGAAFIGEQLQSIAGQNHLVDEIVICDDGSSDATVDLVEKLAADFPVPIALHRNPARLGVTRNFEKAISLCKGGIIFLCDQDDRWMPDKVRVMVDALKAGPVGLVFSNAQVAGENLSPLGYRLWDSIWFDADEQARVKNGDAAAVLLRHAVAAGATLAFRAEYLPLILPIPDFPHSHDIWITQLLTCVSKIEPINQDLIQYRLHGRNQVGMRQYGLLGQIRMARHQIKTDTFDYLTQLNQAAYDRLTSQKTWPVDAKVLQLLREKIRHSQLRHQLPGSWFSRLGVIGGEMRRGNYRKYSYGFKSVLQDLFLR